MCLEIVYLALKLKSSSMLMVYRRQSRSLRFHCHVGSAVWLSLLSPDWSPIDTAIVSVDTRLDAMVTAKGQKSLRFDPTRSGGSCSPAEVRRSPSRAAETRMMT